MHLTSSLSLRARLSVMGVMELRSLKFLKMSEKT
jgi:hypothetical protein